jgi:hypothetical protein
MSERPAKTSDPDPTRQESQESLAYGQDDCKWYRDDERLVSFTGRLESETLWAKLAHLRGIT